MDTVNPALYRGAAFVSRAATLKGYRPSDASWCNLGQGQPETGMIPGGSPRLSEIIASPHDEPYGPVEGVDACREAIAGYYNRLYRVGKSSRYRGENVIVCPGGRMGLLRVLASLSPGRLGYLIPDYMAFESLLEHQAYRIPLTAIALPRSGSEGASPDLLTRTIRLEKLTALLLSNPSNPTGHLISGVGLDEILRAARDSSCSLLMDEFYSHYVYDVHGSPADGPVSMAAHVGDVDADPVLIIDGLTKNFRYPGWRLSWVVGPRDAIENISRVAAGLDGGTSTLVQRAAIEVLQSGAAERETSAIRQLFAQKRRRMIDRLRALGIVVHQEPRGTFYVWGDLSRLPRPFNDASTFFHSALERKVITVPGPLFDLNPRRLHAADPGLRSWMRFSYGPSQHVVDEAMARLSGMLEAAR